MKMQLPVRGAYHFVHPAESGLLQAEFFMRVVEAQGLVDGDILAADSEITAGLFRKRTIQPGGSTRHDLPVKVPRMAGTINATTLAFCNRVHQLAPHSPVIVYSNLSVARQMPSCTGFPLWIAFPSHAAPASVFPWKTWLFWQWGIIANEDQDSFNGTKADMLAWRNTFLPKPPVPTPPTPAPAPAITDEEEDDMQLNNGTNAVTAIGFPGGREEGIWFVADVGLASSMAGPSASPVILRVAVFSNSKGWSQVEKAVRITPSAGSRVNVKFAEKDVSGLSVQRVAGGVADDVPVAFHW
jgi:hypothetical protein